jgi:hypothetical protein
LPYYRSKGLDLVWHHAFDYLGTYIDCHWFKGEVQAERKFCQDRKRNMGTSTYFRKSYVHLCAVDIIGHKRVSFTGSTCHLPEEWAEGIKTLQEVLLPVLDVITVLSTAIIHGGQCPLRVQVHQ